MCHFLLWYHLIWFVGWELVVSSILRQPPSSLKFSEDTAMLLCLRLSVAVFRLQQSPVVMTRSRVSRITYSIYYLSLRRKRLPIPAETFCVGSPVICSLNTFARFRSSVPKRNDMTLSQNWCRWLRVCLSEPCPEHGDAQSGLSPLCGSANLREANALCNYRHTQNSPGLLFSH